MTNLRTYLNQAITAFQQNKLAQVENICSKILNQIPNQADALHLLALVYKQNYQIIDAESYFTKSIESNANQESVHLNFANFLAQNNKPEQAIDSYQKVISLNPNNIDALYNLSLLLNQSNQYLNAIENINKAIRLNSKAPQFYNVLGSAFKNLEQFDDAVIAFKKAIAINPTDFFAWHNLGVTYRIMNKPEKSIHCYEQITSAGDNIPEFHFNIGCANYDLGKLNNAEIALKKAIELRPDYVLAHESLNNLYWENSQPEKFLNSYQFYSNNTSTPTEAMCFSLAAQQILSKQYQKATHTLKSALKTHGNRANFCHALATIYIKDKVQQDDALSLIHFAVNAEPNNIRYRIDMANTLIQQTDYSAAILHLEHALKIFPLNQELWGYMGLCWRLVKDERALWLNNYDKLVNIQKIATPQGYDNFEHFNVELQSVITKLHNTSQRPLDQSVSGGSQTSGNLLLNSSPVIQKLKTAIYNNAQNFLNSLTYDKDHPFLSRIRSGFKFSGCWSVLLNNKGFHSNHLHPEGWISGPTYINVPQSISKSDPNKSGWINFGETSLNLGNREEKGLEYCPQEGDCIFFPSYMWHGTNPTSSDEARITTTVDIQPKG
jgi:uncharacterized protein (TIGR02466 family)